MAREDHERIDWQELRAAEERVRKHLDEQGPRKAARELGWEPPSVLPPMWLVDLHANDGARYVNDAQRLTVILSVSREQDGKRWLHFSLSHQARLPKWSELREAKELFLGDREAYLVMPSSDRYVNLNPFVLHLFACLDGAQLPDFTRGTKSL